MRPRVVASRSKTCSNSAAFPADLTESAAAMGRELGTGRAGCGGAGRRPGWTGSERGLFLAAIFPQGRGPTGTGDDAGFEGIASGAIALLSIHSSAR